MDDLLREQAALVVAQFANEERPYPFTHWPDVEGSLGISA
jgi:hypothetical protein